MAFCFSRIICNKNYKEQKIYTKAWGRGGCFTFLHFKKDWQIEEQKKMKCLIKEEKEKKNIENGAKHYDKFVLFGGKGDI